MRALLWTAPIGIRSSGTSAGWSAASTMTIGESDVRTSAVDAWNPKSRHREVITGTFVVTAMGIETSVLLTTKNVMPTSTMTPSSASVKEVVGPYGPPWRRNRTPPATAHAIEYCPMLNPAFHHVLRRWASESTDPTSC